MRHFALASILSSAALAGCATVLGLDSGDPLEALASEGGVDVTTADAGTDTGSIGEDVSIVEGAAPCKPTQKTCGGGCVEQNDPRYGCGPAGCTACSGANVTTFGCSAGKCTITQCAPGVGDCDKDPANGCEADLSQPKTCGDCAKNCLTTGQTVCSNGTCMTSCPGPQTDCSGACVDLNTNPQHCGACTTNCPAQNGTATCANKTCGILCNPGYLDCNPAIPGCEQAEDAQHCGAGCKDCTTQFSASLHENGACSAGNCIPNGCITGWNDCDHLPANGCEVQGVCPVPDSGPPPDGGCKLLGIACAIASECCVPMTCGGGVACISLDPTAGGHCCFGTGPAPVPCAMNPCCNAGCTAMADGGSMCP
jgi:hypothetical protein